MKLLLRSVATLLALTVITGAVYPLVVTGIARVLFPRQASGSLVERDGRVVGSEVCGQAFADARWFHGRPSATAAPYDAKASSGSNYGPTSAPLAQAFQARAAALRAEGVTGPLPADLLTASGSGLDPHISPAAAFAQVERVARARTIDPAQVHALVEARVELPTFGVLGDERVNVLLLNLDLDDLATRARRPAR
jgi:K+-transporting ATPase ATPase C chain